MIDLSPLHAFANEIAQNLLQGLALAVSAWAMFAFHKYIAPWLGTQVEAQFATNLNTALSNGVSAAMVQLQAYESAHKDVAVQGAVQRLAVQYAINHAPQAIAKFGLTPEQLEVKALSFIPMPPPSAAGTTGETVKTVPVEVKSL